MGILSALTAGSMSHAITPSVLFAGVISRELKQCIVPAHVRSIGIFAFAGCEQLEECQLPVNLERIERNAFNGCIGLKTLTFPKTLNYIGPDAFIGCRSLSDIYAKDFTIDRLKTMVGFPWSATSCNTVFHCQDKNYRVDGVITEPTFEPDGPDIIVPPGEPDDGSIYISDIVGSDLTDSHFSSSDKESALHVYVLGDKIKTVKSNCFTGFKNLETISIERDVSRIGSSAFNNVPNLEYVKIASSVESIGSDAFSRCPYLSTIYFEGRQASDVKKMAGFPWGANTNGTASSNSPSNFYCVDGVLTPRGEYIKYFVTMGRTKIDQNEFWFTGDELGDVALPPTIQEIGVGAFSRPLWKGLSDYSYTTNREDVKYNTWYYYAHQDSQLNFNSHIDAPYITRLFLPYGVKKIGARAFMNSFAFGREIDVTPAELVFAVKKHTGLKTISKTIEDAREGWNDIIDGTTPLGTDKVAARDEINHIMKLCDWEPALLYYSFDMGDDTLLPELGSPIVSTNANGVLAIPSSVTDLGILCFAQGQFSQKQNWGQVRYYIRHIGDYERFAKTLYDGYLHSVRYTREFQEHAHGIFSITDGIILPRHIKSLPDYCFMNIEFKGKVDFSRCENLEKIGDRAFGMFRVNGGDGLKEKYKELSPYRCTTRTDTFSMEAFPYYPRPKITVPSTVKELYTESFGNIGEITIEGRITNIELSAPRKYEHPEENGDVTTSGGDYTQLESLNHLGDAYRVYLPKFSVHEVMSMKWADDAFQPRRAITTKADGSPTHNDRKVAIYCSDGVICPDGKPATNLDFMKRD